ncbi:MAG TPA: beta-ketoacyl-ACP synthase III [Acidimicrobiales bacterium]
MGIRITGWGSALPEKVVTNDDLAGTMDTSDEWIRERTGIRERRVGGTTAGLAIEAARRALERAGRSPQDIDLLVLATTTPDQTIPASSATVQSELGLRCGAFDLNAACSGFVYALVTANAYIEMGLDRVLVVGSDTLSRVTDWTDRATAILFADGAGAVVVERADEPTLLGWDLGCDGTARFSLDCDVGGHIHMDGREVFRRAVRAVVASAEAALARAGLTAADIAWLVPHQANIRIIQSAADKLGIPMERAIEVLSYTGNTSAASIPLALAAAADEGRFAPGDLLLLSGFGAGMTWASAVLRWQP